MCGIDILYQLYYSIIGQRLILERSAGNRKDFGILDERGYSFMEMGLTVCVVIAGLVAVTFLVTRKKVKKHMTKVTFGKIFQFETETEFRKEA